MLYIRCQTVKRGKKFKKITKKDIFGVEMNFFPEKVIQKFFHPSKLDARSPPMPLQQKAKHHFQF